MKLTKLEDITSFFESHKEIRVTVLGREGAGKTTLVKKWKSMNAKGSFSFTDWIGSRRKPTDQIDLHRFQHSNGCLFRVFDFGGQVFLPLVFY
jgi:ABC-type phosphate/phosphonate transport system ATPase subunit